MDDEDRIKQLLQLKGRIEATEDEVSRLRQENEHLKETLQDKDKIDTALHEELTGKDALIARLEDKNEELQKALAYKERVLANSNEVQAELWDEKSRKTLQQRGFCYWSDKTDLNWL